MWERSTVKPSGCAFAVLPCYYLIFNICNIGAAELFVLASACLRLILSCTGVLAPSLLLFRHFCRDIVWLRSCSCHSSVCAVSSLCSAQPAKHPPIVLIRCPAPLFVVELCLKNQNCTIHSIHPKERTTYVHLINVHRFFINYNVLSCSWK